VPDLEAKEINARMVRIEFIGKSALDIDFTRSWFKRKR
jgi:hypothetical protein